MTSVSSVSEDNVQFDLNSTCIQIPTVSALKKLLQMELTLECIDDVEDNQVILYSNTQQVDACRRSH